TAGAAFFTTYVSENLFTVFWILAAIYLIFGIIHQIITRKKYFKAKPENRAKIRFAEIMFAMALVMFTVVVFSVLQYFIKEKTFLFFPMMLSTLAFFIPLLASHTYDAAINIPIPKFNTWAYPINNPIDLPDEDPRERLLVIGFELAKTENQPKRTYFRAKAPEGMKLGELFYHFVNDYNDMQSDTPIEVTNMAGEAYQWLFRTRPKWYKISQVLNAEYSIRENLIKENTVIVAERVLPAQA
ncbi:MAG TPA: TssN family type VI secretion system protein, partial [Phnomibacter sp.]|nr:TssN family type VI secretion system protein [Phnomibacter sp.]